ncbi:hypothetical protein CEXT_536611 [Caerostris extrusa]|uniref:Uncharacterized protein n=1 Tax=Caerostris extrusa TaxID=172846 RepID=A0AAV4Q6D2_CAEEX|nr:hypothetical protein CEXT_536611 [Caerostris extrusa]
MGFSGDIIEWFCFGHSFCLLSGPLTLIVNSNSQRCGELLNMKMIGGKPRFSLKQLFLPYRVTGATAVVENYNSQEYSLKQDHRTAAWKERWPGKRVNSRRGQGR